MPNEKSQPDPGASGSGKRRRATTIDLKATEISSKPLDTEAVSPAASTEPATEPPVGPPPALGDDVAAATPDPTAPGSSGVGFAVYPASTDADTRTPDEVVEPPESIMAAPDIAAATTEHAAAPPPSGAPSPDPSASEAPADDGARERSEPVLPRQSKPSVVWPLTAAAVAGAVAALLVVSLFMWLNPLENPTGQSNTTDPRISALETQLHELANRPAPAAVESKPDSALSARLDRVETALTAPRPAPLVDPSVANRIAAVEGATKTLADNVSTLRRQMDETASALRDARSRSEAAAASLAEVQSAARTANADHDQIAALAQRTEGLERNSRAMADELSKRAATAETDRTVRLAVAAAVLRGAVERGEPFNKELAAVKALGGDATALAPLDPFADRGLPQNAALARDLVALMPAVQAAAGATPREGGFLDRLQANAERLVRVRPVNEPAGDDTSATVGRIEVRAMHGDVSGALAELNKLPANVRAPADAWAARAQAVVKATEANRRFASDAIAGLKTP